MGNKPSLHQKYLEAPIHFAYDKKGRHEMSEYGYLDDNRWACETKDFFDPATGGTGWGGIPGYTRTYDLLHRSRCDGYSDSYILGYAKNPDDPFWEGSIPKSIKNGVITSEDQYNKAYNCCNNKYITTKQDIYDCGTLYAGTLSENPVCTNSLPAYKANLVAIAKQLEDAKAEAIRVANKAAADSKVIKDAADAATQSELTLKLQIAETEAAQKKAIIDAANRKKQEDTERRINAAKIANDVKKAGGSESDAIDAVTKSVILSGGTASDIQNTINDITYKPTSNIKSTVVDKKPNEGIDMKIKIFLFLLIVLILSGYLYYTYGTDTKKAFDGGEYSV